MMISCIVQDDHYFAAAMPPEDKPFEKLKKALGTEVIGVFAGEELSAAIKVAPEWTVLRKAPEICHVTMRS